MSINRVVYRYNSTCQSIQWTRDQLVVESFSWKNAPIENIAPPKKIKNLKHVNENNAYSRSFHLGGDSWFIFGMGLWPRPWQHWKNTTWKIIHEQMRNFWAFKSGIAVEIFPISVLPTYRIHELCSLWHLYNILNLFPYFPPTRIPAFYKQYKFRSSMNPALIWKKIAVANSYPAVLPPGYSWKTDFLLLRRG